MVEHARKMRILKLMLVMILSSHSMACCLGMSTMFANQKLESFWGTHGYCWAEDLYSLGPGEPLKARCVDAWQQYFVCFHLAFGLIFGIPAEAFFEEGPGEKHFAFTDTFQIHEHVYATLCLKQPLEASRSKRAADTLITP